ncbi:hypothetical protein MMC31_006819 [Peltigera leucophlebia]|nr:hypothetical protein [Peltigera leucophlebia]
MTTQVIRPLSKNESRELQTTVFFAPTTPGHGTPSRHGISSSSIWWHVFSLLAIISQKIDDHTFKTGSPPSLFTSDLYQIQVTGLISLALVIIRLLGCSCSALLVWRTIFILLDKRLITLTELAHLANYQLPIIPRKGSKFQLFWSCWAVAVAVLLWPPGFAAPLANSSVAWIPSIRLSNTLTLGSMEAVGKFADWAALGNEDMRTIAVINAASMAEKDPVYAFHSTQLSLRRYFSSNRKITTNSTMDLTLPYFDVRLRWIDAASDNQSHHVGDPKYADIANLGNSIRINGSVAVIRNDTWDAGEATPQAAETFSGTKLISIKVGTLNYYDQLPDGSSPKESSPCPTSSVIFGKLPDVGQGTTGWFSGDTWVANDCYLIAEASIMAGRYKGTDCTVSPTSAVDYMATCIVTPNPRAVEDDWISGLALDFTSETMKNIVMLNLTQPWMHNNLDSYTTGTLTLAYHAALAESVVRATVDRTRIRIWFAMSAMLTVSALLVAVAQNVSITKTVRDTTLAALAMDLTKVTHSDHASELCNAVALSQKDHKLARLKWTDNCDRRNNHICRRRVVFAESDINAHGRPLY